MHGLSEHRVFFVTAGDEVCEEVEDFVLLQHVEQAFGHRGDRGVFDGFDLFAIDVLGLVGIEHVGVQAHGVAGEIHDSAGHAVAAEESDHDRCVLVAYFLAGIERGFQQVTCVESSARSGQVWTDNSAFSGKTVAGNTGRRWRNRDSSDRWQSVVPIHSWSIALRRNGGPWLRLDSKSWGRMTRLLPWFVLVSLVRVLSKPGVTLGAQHQCV